MKKLILSFAAMTAMTTVSAQKMLVLYYSETGTTKTVAEELQQQLGADIEAVEAVEPYSGNFQETIQRGQREMQNGMPAIKPLKSDIKKYDILEKERIKAQKEEEERKRLAEQKAKEEQERAEQEKEENPSPTWLK